MTKAERAVVRAAMRWLRWMEEVNRAEMWLREKPFERDSAVPILLRACARLAAERKRAK